MGLEEAMGAENADKFIKVIEGELRRLLAAPEGTVLGLPLLAPPYQALLNSACARFGMQTEEFHRGGRVEINVSSTSATWELNDVVGGKVLAPCPGLRIPAGSCFL
jgi:hypothetical protein